MNERTRYIRTNPRFRKAYKMLNLDAWRTGSFDDTRANAIMDRVKSGKVSRKFSKLMFEVWELEYALGITTYHWPKWL